MLWQDTQAKFQLFQSEIQKLSLTTLEGGRFISIQSQFDKGKAMKWWQRVKTRPFLLIALGDSPSDALLVAADVAVVINSASRSTGSAGPATIIRTGLPGPAGWRRNRAILNCSIATTAHC